MDVCGIESFSCCVRDDDDDDDEEALMTVVKDNDYNNICRFPDA